MTTVESITTWAKWLYPSLNWDIKSNLNEDKKFLQVYTLNGLDYAEIEITNQIFYSGYGDSYKELIDKVANEVINKSYEQEYLNACN